MYWLIAKDSIKCPGWGRSVPVLLTTNLKFGAYLNKKKRTLVINVGRNFVIFLKHLLAWHFWFWFLNDLDNCLYSACEKKKKKKIKERYASLCMPLLHYFIILYCILSSVLYVDMNIVYFFSLCFLKAITINILLIV